MKAADVHTPLCHSGSLHAGDPFGPNSGAMGGIGSKVESIPGSEAGVAIGDVEGNGAFDAKQHLVEGVTMLSVCVAGLIGPCPRHQALGCKSVGSE